MGTRVELPTFKFEARHLRFMIGKAEEMKGKLTITIFGAEGDEYRIYYYPRDRCGLLGKMVWDEREGKEHPVQCGFKLVLADLNAENVTLHVRHSNGEKRSAWFGPDRGMRPTSEAYGYIASFEPHDD